MHTFEATVPMATRAKVVGAIINARIEDFEFSDGQVVEAFQRRIGESYEGFQLNNIEMGAS